MPTTGEGREVGNVKTATIPKAGVCTMCAPPGMSVA